MRNILCFEILIVKVSEASSLRKCFLTVFDALFEILELVNIQIFEILVSNQQELVNSIVFWQFLVQTKNHMVKQIVVLDIILDSTLGFTQQAQYEMEPASLRPCHLPPEREHGAQMTEESFINWDKVFGLAARGRPGFNAFCTSIDLCGIKCMMRKNLREARARLDDLQQGFGYALILFPGGEDYRVCFAGDSLFVVKELSPDDDWTKQWPIFCGHLFAMASMLQDMETNIENLGLRAIASYGQLFQLREPDSWREEPVSKYTRNWLVLTGATDALLKSTEAERQGKKSGFLNGYFWHEDPVKEFNYRGTPLCKVPPEQCCQPALYQKFYYDAIQKADKESVLHYSDC